MMKSVTLVSSLPKLGNKSKLYKIVVLKDKLPVMFIYSIVEYTVEYIYRIIILRSDFVVIFESSQKHHEWLCSALKVAKIMWGSNMKLFPKIMQVK